MLTDIEIVARHDRADIIEFFGVYEYCSENGLLRLQRKGDCSACFCHNLILHE